MSKGRTIPVIFAPEGLPTEGYRRAMEQDEAFFRANPHLHDYSRPYVPGECSPDFPQGTTVHVRRLGDKRARGFAPPTTVRVN